MRFQVAAAYLLLSVQTSTKLLLLISVLPLTLTASNDAAALSYDPRSRR